MITDRGMAAFRTGAALVHLVPQLRLRVRHGDVVVADVARPPFTDGGHPQISACAFHDSVARAHARHRAGEQLRFLSLPEEAEPEVDIVVPPDDLALPAGIVRVTAGNLWLHLVAVARSLDDCLAVTGALGLHGVGFHHDAAVGVTVLHASCVRGDELRSRRALEGIERGAVRCTVADLEDYLRATSKPPTVYGRGCQSSKRLPSGSEAQPKRPYS